MRYPNRIRAVLACCVFTAITTAWSQCCIAYSADADSESALDDSWRAPHHPGNTPFPKFIPFYEASGARAPSPPVAIALCNPDLYCSLEPQ